MRVFQTLQELEPQSLHTTESMASPQSPEGQLEVTHLLLAGYTNGGFGDDLDGKLLSTLVGHQLHSAVSTSAKDRGKSVGV